MTAPRDILFGETPEPSRPKPTAWDWVEYDQRIEQMHKISVDASKAAMPFLSRGWPDAAAVVLAGYAPAYDRWRLLPKPGTPAWYERRA